MDEIPTAVVDKLPMGLDQGFVVLNRPYGFLQWVRKHMRRVTEAYILMIEPDYIFMRPPPLLATPTQSAAYHFTYMLPEKNRDVIEPYNEKGVPYETILPIGARSNPLSPHHSVLANGQLAARLLKCKPSTQCPKPMGVICRECACHDSQEQSGAHCGGLV